jgi:transposase
MWRSRRLRPPSRLVKGDSKSGHRPLAWRPEQQNPPGRARARSAGALPAHGQRNDITQAKALIEGLPAEWVLGDTAFDADHFRRDIEAINARAVIPSNPSRALKHPLDKHLYKERHLVECCFNKLKHFRRIATRYEKTARNFLAMILAVATVLWLR